MTDEGQPAEDEVLARARRWVRSVSPLIARARANSPAERRADEFARALLAEVARREAAERAANSAVTWAERYAEMTKRAKAAEQRLQQAEAALEPFAKEAGAYDPPEGDAAWRAWQSIFTIGQLRVARAALEGRTTGGKG